MISIGPVMGEIEIRAMESFDARAPATMMTDLGARLADDDHLRIDLRRILTTAMRVMAGLIAPIAGGDHPRVALTRMDLKRTSMMTADLRTTMSSTGGMKTTIFQIDGDLRSGRDPGPTTTKAAIVRTLMGWWIGYFETMRTEMASSQSMKFLPNCVGMCSGRIAIKTV